MFGIPERQAQTQLGFFDCLQNKNQKLAKMYEIQRIMQLNEDFKEF